MMQHSNNLFACLAFKRINECSTFYELLNFECTIQMLMLCTNKMMYFGNFVVLVPYISSEFIFIT